MLHYAVVFFVIAIIAATSLFAALTTRAGRHLNCLDYPLSATFPALARLPHVGTMLSYGTASCLQTWTLTVVFDPHARPRTLVAAVYDQFEW